MKIRLALVVCILMLFAGAGALLWEYQTAFPVDAKANFVGGDRCIDCHQQQHQLFRHSHHDMAMDVATEETVLAKFDGTKIEHFGITSTVYRDGPRFMVNTEGPSGALEDFEVKMVFGCEPLQQYMVEMKGPGEPESVGQLQVLRLCWDVAKQEWFYLTPPDVRQKLEPDDPLHWTGITQRWNTNCAVCHSTNLHKNFDSLTGNYSTTYTDIDVSCEACHGPGSLHLAIAKKRRFFWDKNHGKGITNPLKSSDHVQQVETCAPCHSRRAEVCTGHIAGKKFEDYFSSSLLSNGVYHDDGQIKAEDYVYGSFTQSKMYHQGIRCTDCHDPHSTKLKHSGNQVCTSCHQHPAGKYDTPAHHRHSVGSTGALCVDCHMPATTYMSIDARRDHSLRVPRPDLSVKYGTPNACTACHIDKKNLPQEQANNLDQYLDWLVAAENGDEAVARELDRLNQQMADAFTQWYPEAATKETRSKYYEQLVIGKSAAPNAVETLLALSQDDRAPAIFRASAVEALAEKAITLDLSTLKRLFGDSSPKVLAATLAAADRQIANAISTARYGDPSAISAEFAGLINQVKLLLTHELLLIRASAARSLANVPIAVRQQMNIDSAQLKRALDDYKQSLRTGNDLAANHMALGAIYETEGQLEKAEVAYRNAIAVEPNYTGPRSNLAALLENQIESIRTAMIRSPRSPDHVANGARIDRLLESAQRLRREENELLKKDVARAEQTQTAAHNLFYRYGLSCYLMKQPRTAERYLLKAQQLEPNSETYLLGLATYYVEANQFEAAIQFINKLLQLKRNHPGYRRLRDQALAGLKDQQFD